MEVSINARAGLLSSVWLFATPWTGACQAPLPMEFSRQEYWSGAPFPSPWGIFSYVSCIGRQVLLPLAPPGKPSLNKCCYNLAAKSLQSFPTLYDPHRQQPTKFCHPCDSSGKNTGVGCHFLLQCMKVKSESEIAQSCPTLSDPMDCSLPGSFVHGVFQATVLEWGAIIAIQIQNRICCFEIL